jgi:hypothetical protein
MQANRSIAGRFSPCEVTTSGNEKRKDKFYQLPNLLSLEKMQLE